MRLLRTCRRFDHNGCQDAHCPCSRFSQRQVAPPTPNHLHELERDNTNPCSHASSCLFKLEPCKSATCMTNNVLSHKLLAETQGGQRQKLRAHKRHSGCANERLSYLIWRCETSPFRSLFFLPGMLQSWTATMLSHVFWKWTFQKAEGGWVCIAMTFLLRFHSGSPAADCLLPFGSCLARFMCCDSGHGLKRARKATICPMVCTMNQLLAVPIDAWAWSSSKPQLLPGRIWIGFHGWKQWNLAITRRPSNLNSDITRTVSWKIVMFGGPVALARFLEECKPHQRHPNRLQ